MRECVDPYWFSAKVHHISAMSLLFVSTLLGDKMSDTYVGAVSLKKLKAIKQIH